MAVDEPHGADPSRQLLKPKELKVRRQALGLSQQALGRALGVSGNTLARWERGTQRLANPQLVRLALERIELGRAAPDPTAPGPFRTGRSHNLPSALTSFVGRRRELRVLRRLVLSSRLVTVTGAAGIGKTRLAVEAARGLTPRFAQGVWLIELAPVAEPGLVPNALAAALRVPEEPDRPRLQSVIATLADCKLLLVLDNCEHLVAACAEVVAELLRGCPMLHVLTTSREPLGVAGELTWRVPSLSLPAEDQPVDVQRLLRSEAAALFVARARTAAPGFTVVPGVSKTVAEICRRLDGLPLALELAAARLRGVGVTELAARLDDRFRLLVGGPLGGPAHHVTLQTTIDWSYTLIPEVERQLFGRLAVFAGGWTLPAAEAVCPGGPVEADMVLELLSRLVDRSLVVAEPAPDGTVRYRLLETLRAYAAQALNLQDRIVAECRHAAFYLALAESAEPRLVRAEQVEWAVRLEQELPNVRAVLGWCLSTVGDASTGLRLASALAHFWQLGPHLREGRSWLGRLLTAAPSDLPERAAALWADGFLAWQVGDLPGAAATYKEGLACARRSKPTPYLALLQIGLGTVLGLVRGDLAAGQALVEEGLAGARERGEQWAIGHALFWLPWIGPSRATRLARVCGWRAE